MDKSIKEYIKGDGGQLVMDGGATIPVSRSYKSNLIAKLRTY